MKYHLELLHQINILHSWATDESKDTLSTISEKNAKEALYRIKALWQVLDRRKR